MRLRGWQVQAALPADLVARAGGGRYVADRMPPLPPLLSSRRAFTMLEICVVMFLAMLLMATALPSLSGQLSEGRLQKTFDRFDQLVTEAQRRSVTESKPYVLTWGRGGLRLFPADWDDDQRRKAGPVASLDEDDNGKLVIDRSASLAPGGQPPAEWTFWPSGNCEPVSVRYQGPSGEWQADYNPLSARGTVNRFMVR